MSDLVASVEPAKRHGGNNNPEGKNQYTVADLVASVEPAMPHGGVVGQDSNSTLSSDQPKRQKRDAAYWIARLKRDAATNTHAAALLGSIEAGDIKPYRAAVDMGWVKTPDPAVIIEKNYAKLDVKDQVMLWEQWGRALPEKSVDRVGIAVEALLNCTEGEQRQVWKRVRSGIGSAVHC